MLSVSGPQTHTEGPPSCGEAVNTATKKAEKSELLPGKDMECYNCFGKEFGIFPKDKTVNIQPAHQS